MPKSTSVCLLPDLFVNLRSFKTTDSRLPETQRSQGRTRTCGFLHLFSPKPGYLLVSAYCNSKFFLRTRLHCVSSVKIGVLRQHSSAQLLQNLSTALPHVVKNIRENWDNVQSIHIKTSSSASLPIWSCGLDDEEGGRWDGLTRVPIPDDMDADEDAGKGKKRAVESEEEPRKKKKKSNTSPTSQPSRLDPPPLTESFPSKSSKVTRLAASAELSKGMKGSASESSTKKSTKGPTEVRQRSPRAAVVDSPGSDDLESPGHLSLSKPSASKAPIPPKSIMSNPPFVSKDPTLMKSKSRGEKPSETKTILKSSKKIIEPTTLDIPAKAKHVKFAVKPPDPKMKRDKALGTTDKKVRSGGGKSASAKDRVLGKKVAVK
jgi:ribosome biogenesis protein UTP30